MVCGGFEPGGLSFEEMFEEPFNLHEFAGLHEKLSNGRLSGHLYMFMSNYLSHYVVFDMNM